MKTAVQRVTKVAQLYLYTTICSTIALFKTKNQPNLRMSSRTYPNTPTQCRPPYLQPLHYSTMPNPPHSVTPSPSFHHTVFPIPPHGVPHSATRCPPCHHSVPPHSVTRPPPGARRCLTCGQFSTRPGSAAVTPMVDQQRQATGQRQHSRQQAQAARRAHPEWSNCGAAAPIATQRSRRYREQTAMATSSPGRGGRISVKICGTYRGRAL